MIRLKNLDLNTPGMRGNYYSDLGDITATTERTVFISPVACTVDQVDIYTKQAVNPSASNSVTIMTIRPALNSASASVLATARGNSGNGASSTNDIQANTRYRITPTANNSLSIGTPIMITFSQQGSGVMSAVFVHVTYTPLKHRETR